MNSVRYDSTVCANAYGAIMRQIDILQFEIFDLKNEVAYLTELGTLLKSENIRLKSIIAGSNTERELEKNDVKDI